MAIITVEHESYYESVDESPLSQREPPVGMLREGQGAGGGAVQVFPAREDELANRDVEVRRGGINDLPLRL